MTSADPPRRGQGAAAGHLVAGREDDVGPETSADHEPEPRIAQLEHVVMSWRAATGTATGRSATELHGRTPGETSASTAVGWGSDV
jgi:hypothetical protein